MYVGSRCCDRTSTATDGIVCRISTAATSPSSALPGGIRTSTIAMSGEYKRTFSRRSSASTARPTTSWPASTSSDAIPSRRSALSSATTTRSDRAAPSVSPSTGVASLVPMTVIVDARILQRVEHDVARILAETDVPVEVYLATLDSIGRSLGWELGAVWETGPDDERLRCVCTWHAGDGAPEFEALSERLTLESGEGLPGRVLESGEPVWIVDAPVDRNFPRADAAPALGPARRLRLPAPQRARDRRRDGVLLAGGARPGRAAARDDGRARQPGRASSSRAGTRKRRCGRASRGCGRCSRRRSTPS